MPPTYHNPEEGWRAPPAAGPLPPGVAEAPPGNGSVPPTYHNPEEGWRAPPPPPLLARPEPTGAPFTGITPPAPADLLNRPDPTGTPFTGFGPTPRPNVPPGNVLAELLPGIGQHPENFKGQDGQRPRLPGMGATEHFGTGVWDPATETSGGGSWTPGTNALGSEPDQRTPAPLSWGMPRTGQTLGDSTSPRSWDWNHQYPVDPAKGVGKEPPKPKDWGPSNWGTRGQRATPGQRRMGY